jgi:Mn2+/Fe2+ NRAMP family transporter
VVWNLHTHPDVQRAGAVERTGPFYWAAALLIMNLLDGIFTLAAVHAGAASEANPLMQLPLHWGAVWFIAVKTGLVSAGVLMLWRARERFLAHAGLVGLTLVYAGVVVYHLSAVSLWSDRVLL